MSLFIAMAMEAVGYQGFMRGTIISCLYLPEVVKKNLKQNFIRYLHAVELEGYDEHTIRKMMIVGNTGKKAFTSILYFIHTMK